MKKSYLSFFIIIKIIIFGNKKEMNNFVKYITQMEQLINTTWFFANMSALYIGIKAKFLYVRLQYEFLTVEELRYVALVLGIISSIAFLGYNVSKWYQQVLDTKKFKKENNVDGLFTFKSRGKKLKQMKQTNKE